MRFILALLCCCVCFTHLRAQSLTVTQDFRPIPNSLVMASYKNQFGKWEKPDLDDTFPYAVVRVRLEGNAREVSAAKKRIGLYLGTMRMVMDKCTDIENEILFLIPSAAGHVEILCGDGCEKQTIIDQARLKSNTVYYGKVHFVPEPDPELGGATIVHTGPQFYPFMLTVKPTNARVDVIANGVRQEWILDNGVANLTLLEGKYRYTISAPDHITKEGYLSVDAMHSDTTISLVSKYGWLTVNSDSTDLTEESMELQLMGKETQNVALPIDKMRCEPGTYIISIHKRGYLTYNNVITIEAGETTVLAPALTSKHADRKRPTPAPKTKQPKTDSEPQPTTPVDRVTNTMLLAEAGFTLNPAWGVGLMFGQTYNGIGWFLKARSNFQFQTTAKDLLIQQGGLVNGEMPFYTGEKKATEMLANVGVVYDFLGKKEKKHKNTMLGMYLGAGYGMYQSAWQINDGRWLKYATSTSSVSCTAGVIGAFAGITISAGVSTIGFKYMEAEVGIGYTF